VLRFAPRLMKIILRAPKTPKLTSPWPPASFFRQLTLSTKPHHCTSIRAKRAFIRANCIMHAYGVLKKMVTAKRQNCTLRQAQNAVPYAQNTLPYARKSAFPSLPIPKPLSYSFYSPKIKIDLIAAWFGAAH